MLSNETAELLEGFEKRMKFVNVIKYIKKHGFTGFFAKSNRLMFSFFICLSLKHFLPYDMLFRSIVFPPLTR